MKSKKRIQWLDCAKCITILGVIIVHSGNPINLLNSLLLICIMPTFFAISGYLYKPTTNIKKYILMLYKKISSFLVPYIVFTIILLLLHMIKYHSLVLSYSDCFMPIKYMWFLFSLFFIFIIVGIMDLCHLQLYIQVLISLLLMFGQMLLPWKMTSNGNINPLASIGGYTICFILGECIKDWNLQKILNKRIFLCTLLLSWIIISVFQSYVTNINNDMFYPSNFIVKLLSIFVVFSFFICCYRDDKVFSYFTKYGKYTLIIYLVHYPIVTVLTLLMRSNIITFLVIVLIGWYSSIFVCYLSNRCKFINFIFYTRKYINKFIMHTNFGQKLFKIKN